MQYRKKARDSVYKLVFEYLFLERENPRTLAIMTAVDMPGSESEYITAVYRGVIEHADELKETVSKYAVNFKSDRIFLADMAAMLIAVYEMKYMDDIPLGVSISEAVELVKTYSTEKSYSYVNGILSSVYKELTAQ